MEVKIAELAKIPKYGINAKYLRYHQPNEHFWYFHICFSKLVQIHAPAFGFDSFLPEMSQFTLHETRSPAILPHQSSGPLRNVPLSY